MKTETSDTPKTDAEQFYPDGRLAKPWVEVSFARELERENARLRKVVDAARCIRHWHDTANGGMIVSGYAVHHLWAAISEFDSLA